MSSDELLRCLIRQLFCAGSAAIAIATLDHFVESVFVDMFGNVVENDRSSPVAQIKDFVLGSKVERASPPRERGRKEATEFLR